MDSVKEMMLEWHKWADSNTDKFNTPLMRTMANVAVEEMLNSGTNRSNAIDKCTEMKMDAVYADLYINFLTDFVSDTVESKEASVLIELAKFLDDHCTGTEPFEIIWH